jgi:hypothetical protein
MLIGSMLIGSVPIGSVPIGSLSSPLQHGAGELSDGLRDVFVEQLEQMMQGVLVVVRVNLEVTDGTIPSVVVDGAGEGVQTPPFVDALVQRCSAGHQVMISARSTRFLARWIAAAGLDTGSTESRRARAAIR